MDLLVPVIQPFAWGSRYAIAEIQDRSTPTSGPEAELWMGAHPSGPSGLERAGRETTLDAAIAADPVGELGHHCVDRFGPRLPFMLKILAAEKALSIQVHPNRAQAESGFRAENAHRGESDSQSGRNYVDDWPKPEILCALTPFEALAGLRSPGDAAAALEALAIDDLHSLISDLRTHDDSESVRRVLGQILTWPASSRALLLHRVVVACAKVAENGGPYAPGCEAAVRIAADHPTDMGVLASLLLRHLVLRPGEALFMPAGGLHAYLKGVGVELLANSDNVLRAGLTGKHLDIPELLRIVDPAVTVPVLRPRELTDTIAVYDTAVPEFRLYRLNLAASPVTLPGSGPRLVLCVEGAATLRDDAGRSLRLTRGRSCFVPARDAAVTVTGPAALIAGTVG